jgi:hypothetical protein
VNEDEMGISCSTHGKRRNAYRVFVRKPERKRPLGIHIGRWEDDIKMDLK